MKHLQNYINRDIGLNLQVKPLPKKELTQLPVFITESYSLSHGNIDHKDFILLEVQNEADVQIAQLAKHIALIRNKTGEPVVTVFQSMEAYNRRRLIEKRVNFIVPGKQLFIPEFLMDLRERFDHVVVQDDQLTATSQLLLLYHLQHFKKNSLEEQSFKQIAQTLNINAMAVTRAAENLRRLKLCNVEGGKEKFLRFEKTRMNLWKEIEERRLWINPVAKRIYMDEKPGVALLLSNESALAEYTDLNPTDQQYFAMEKTQYYKLIRRKRLNHEMGTQGTVVLEVWHYNPAVLAEGSVAVDPLSLYISLKDVKDERVEAALSKMIDSYRW